MRRRLRCLSSLLLLLNVIFLELKAEYEISISLKIDEAPRRTY